MPIKVTENIISDAITKGKKVIDVMAEVYEAEIADKVKVNEKFAKLSPLELAMVDAGLSKKSLVKDFYTDSSNTLLFPAIVDTRIAELTAANPMLQYVSPTIQLVPGMSVKGLKLDWNSTANKAALKKRDIAEGADLPIVSITTGSGAISLFKRGLAVRTSYEALMFSTVEMFMRTLNAISLASSNQQLGDAIDVLANGDGNSNGILTAATEGTTSAAFVAADVVDMCVAFNTANNGMALDTIVCNTTIAKQLLNMVVANTNDPGYKLGKSFEFPQYNLGNITVIGDDRVPQTSTSKNVMIGLNRENALTKYVAAGSQINEIAANIQNQTKLGTLSEIVGFGRFIDSAAIAWKTK